MRKRMITLMTLAASLLVALLATAPGGPPQFITRPPLNFRRASHPSTTLM